MIAIKTPWFIVLLVLPFCGILATGVPPKTGRELLDKMNSKAAVDRDYASVFISGVYAAHTGIQLPPEGEELKGLVKRVKEFLEANPKRIDEAVGKLLNESFDKVPRPIKKYSFTSYGADVRSL